MAELKEILLRKLMVFRTSPTVLDFIVRSTGVSSKMACRYKPIRIVLLACALALICYVQSASGAEGLPQS
jgi:hypothetical protein